MSWRRLTMAGLVLGACLVGFGAGGVGAEPPPGEPIRSNEVVANRPVVVDDAVVAELNTLLAERSAAILDGRAGSDNLRFADSIGDEVLERWGRLVRGFAQIGVVVYEESVSEPALDLTTVVHVDRFGPGVVAVEVARTWQLAEVDRWAEKDSLVLAFVEAQGGWEIADDDALRSVGVTSSRTFWEVTDIAVVRTAGFVVVGSPNISGRLDEVADIANQARDRLIDVDVPEPLLVMVPEGAAQAEAYLQSPLDLSKFVAFVAFGIDRADEVGWAAGPPRLVLQEGNLRRRSVDHQIETLSHELAHAATLHLSGPHEPLWLHEGLADWQAELHPRAPTGLLELPEGHQFRTGATADIVAAYGVATDIVSRLGENDPDLPARLFEAVGARRSNAGTVEFHVDAALSDLGVDRAALEAG
ncbi:MAG: hypothetical protein ACI8Y4_001180 [Candidatus Poriferisodalaceae bacterium]